MPKNGLKKKYVSGCKKKIDLENLVNSYIQ